MVKVKNYFCSHCGEKLVFKEKICLPKFDNFDSKGKKIADKFKYRYDCPNQWGFFKFFSPHDTMDFEENGKLIEYIHYP